MAKKLVYNYTFTPGAAGVGTLEITGNYPLKVFQLITNVTDGIIIFNFADPAKGGSTSYDSETDKTTLTLDHDTSAMAADDAIQIFIDLQDEKVDFSETFTDPVSKLRVSNPQNLIDTDFEYGLQPTKWETIELVNNVPSFFASSADYSISDVVSVTTVTGSENITVNTLDEHGLTVGSPIDVQGLTSRTAEGKYLISSVIDATSFVYKARAKQESSGTISGSYTVITPGEFYQGSDIDIDEEIGIETDGSAQSALKIKTDYHHGFSRGSSLYLTNTVGSKKLTISDSATATAPDGRPFVDFEDSLTRTVNTTSEFNETRQMTGTYALKFTSSSVNTVNNTIGWNNHQLQAGDALLYSKPSGDSKIGGLDDFQIYYVKNVVDANNITLCATTNGDYTNNAEISLSSTGTSNYGRHTLILCYEITRIRKPVYQYDTYIYTRRNIQGSGSGRDLVEKGQTTDADGNTGYWGLSGKAPERWLMVNNSNTTISTIYFYEYFGQRRNSNFVLGSTALDYNFLEDFNRFNNTNTYIRRSTGLNQNLSASGTYGYRFYRSGSGSYYGNYSTNYAVGTTFFVPMLEDTESDTLYIPNHNLETGATGTITTTAGSDITYRTDTNPAYNVTATTATLSSGSSAAFTVVSGNRVKLTNTERLRTAAGDYTIVANLDNPTKNTFYFNTHDLNTTDGLTLTTSGALPLTTTGVVDPQNSSLQVVYDSVKSTLESVKSTMAADSGLLLYNRSTHYYPFGAANSIFDSGRQYFLWYISTMRLYISGISGYVNSDSFANNSYATGKVWDPFQNSVYANKGYFHIQSPFTGLNTTTPFFINAYQVPNPVDEGGTGTASMYFSSRNAYSYSGSSAQTSISNTYANWLTLSDGWEYTYEAQYYAPNATYHGRQHIYIILSNTNWSGHQASWTQNLYWPAANRPYPITAGYGGQRYAIEVIIPIKAGTTASRYGATGTVKDTASIVTDIVTGVKNRLTNPDLSTAGGSVFAQAVSADRFALQNSFGVTYNLTSSGTSPFSFQTEEKTGGVDGYISIDAKTDTTMSHFSKNEIPKRTISVAPTDIVDIGGILYINKNDYKMKTKQQMVYTESGGTIPITTGGGLVDGSTYYAVSNGPNHFQIAASADDADAGNVISIGTTSSGSFTFTVPSVSGISSAVGNVGVTSDSKTITGTDTLFKRYFRSGDKLTIVDEENPPQYIDYEIASVIGDTELTITENPGIDITSGKYYVETKVNTRPDGTFIHRPFDGGVEITAGTSPNSSIVRQTRKYFRYQSGKGIQCSVAINFNPSRIANTIVGTANTTLSIKTYSINVNNIENNSYNISGDDRTGRVLGENERITITKGDTANLFVNASGHPFWIKDTAGTGTANAVTTGITNNGTASGTIVWDTTNVTAGTYYYNCENHGSMAGEIVVEPVGVTSSYAKVTTSYPHGLTRRNSVTVRGAADSVYNGSHPVLAADDFTFEYLIDPATTSIPNGIIEYNVDSWSNSAVRCGLFDYQNGMFFEYDGSTLYAVRRSSVQQLSGSVSVQKNSNIVTGTDTNFSGQLNIGDFIVIRGTSYRITNLPNKTTMHIQPAYKGVAASGVVITKTIDTKVPQDQWNIDKADGTGPSGFVIDTTKIQMAYIDYSWYGAGKIRFGFKDAKGHVKYMHEFLHNNKLEEAYMRSGNIPGRYEIENTSDSVPTYVPSLFHWGTSVIMDGKFDDDKAYLFTAPSNNLTFTNGDSNAVTTTGVSSLIYQYNWAERKYYWYVRIPFASTDGAKFSSGTALYTDDGQLDGELVEFIDYSGSTARVHIYVGESRRFSGSPAVYPSLANATDVHIGAPSTGGDTVDLQSEVPLISIRLAPSVDNNLTGSLGQREIINRMQLQLKQLGITLSHDCNVDLILNGAISNRSFEDVTSPSLSELVKHVAGDKVIGGTKIFSLRASGGTENAAGKRLSSTNDFDISQITDLGNSIIGGDGTFPNGPDILTIAIQPVNTSEINADSPLTVSSRITWTESQA